MAKLLERVSKQYAKYCHYDNNLRDGQKWWNALHDIHLNKSHEITATELDPFYDDTKVEAFLEWLKEQ